jgi:hypothetical protein
MVLAASVALARERFRAVLPDIRLFSLRMEIQMYSPQAAAGDILIQAHPT